jgi:hypothetical protein
MWNCDGKKMNGFSFSFQLVAASSQALAAEHFVKKYSLSKG